MGIIYKITCDINFFNYIGRTSRTLEERINEHKRDAKVVLKTKDYPLYKDIRKYGWKHFNVEVLEDNIPLEKLNEREIYWTEKFNALWPRGYCLKAGGELAIFSEKTRKKMSKSKKGNKNALGHKCSEKTRKKISKSLKGKCIGKNHPMAKSVSCYDLEGNFLKKYDCIKDASIELNLYHTSIVQICKGKRKRTSKYKFKYD